MTEKKIVVVDDDECIRKTFAMILHEKYCVFSAKDPREALKEFQKAGIDLIIADLKLPFINGIEMIEQFRSSGYQGEVILISAFPDLVSADELARLSIARFFVKPLDLSALTQAIEQLLNGGNRFGPDMKEREPCRME